MSPSPPARPTVSRAAHRATPRLLEGAVTGRPPVRLVALTGIASGAVELAELRRIAGVAGRAVATEAAESDKGAGSAGGPAAP